MIENWLENDGTASNVPLAVSDADPEADRLIILDADPLTDTEFTGDAVRRLDHIGRIEAIEMAELVDEGVTGALAVMDALTELDPLVTGGGA